MIVMIYNFETEEFEQVSTEEGKEWVELIEVLNEDCANATHI